MPHERLAKTLIGALQHRLNATPADTARNTLSQGTGLSTASNAVQLADHERMLAQNARHIEDFHAAQLEAMGMEGSEAPEADPINVQGDTFNIDVQEAAPAPTTAASNGSLLPWALAAIMGSGLVGGAAYMIGKGSGKPSDTDTQYGLDISDEAPQASK